MGSRRPRWSGRSMMKLVVVACFAVAAVASVCRGRCFVVACRSGVLRSDFRRMAGSEARSGDVEDHYYVGRRRRRLLSGVGPGSHPPRCTSKCGSCSPCSPVHVPVPPGVLVTTEYYPEAWRCKCRNRFYMP